MEKEFLDDVITLVDEEGNEVEFELIMSMEANDREYAILAPLQEDEELEDDEAYIFRLEYDEEEEMLLIPIEDDEEYEMVVEVYNTLIEEE
ncbi:MAG: DUF1292 domain-containing protein [Peptostreptococcaceae bacterium]|nr:DUF1292 domain-containing protein [Peptostreptococcaceae bacterium]